MARNGNPTELPGRLFCAALGGLLGALVIALPCAIIFGHHGPDWPLALMGLTAAVGSLIGWRTTSA